MSIIDEKIVQLALDNSNFEKNASTSLGTIDRLKAALDFESVTSGMTSLFSAAVSTIESNLLGMVNSVSKTVEQFTTGAMDAGFQKYEDKTRSVKTIMAATGDTIDEVNGKLEKLMWFSDETSYSFTNMTDAVGKFVSAGVGLDEAVTAAMGISAWGAEAGQNSSTVGRALYNLSQAYGIGALTAQDWKSIELANMATAEFKESTLELAEAMGKLERAENGALVTAKGSEVTVGNFRETLQDKWFDVDLMTAVFSTWGEYADTLYDVVEETGVEATFWQKYINEFASTGQVMSKWVKETGLSTEELTEYLERLNDPDLSLARKAFKMAQEATTWTDAVDATVDAVSTGWMRIYESIFGNYEEATQLFTDITSDFWEIFAQPVTYLADVFKEWHDDGGREELLSGFYDLRDGIWSIQETLWGTLTDTFSGIDKSALDSVTQWVVDLGSSFKSWTEQTDKIERWSTILTNALRTVMSVLSSFGQVASSVWKQLEGVVGTFGNWLTDWLEKIFDLDSNESAASKITKFASDLSTKISTAIDGQNWSAALTTTATKVNKFVTDLTSKISTAIGDQNWSEKLSTVVDGVTNAFSKVKEWVVGENFVDERNSPMGRTIGLVETLKNYLEEVTKSLDSIKKDWFGTSSIDERENPMGRQLGYFEQMRTNLAPIIDDVTTLFEKTKKVIADVLRQLGYEIDYGLKDSINARDGEKDAQTISDVIGNVLVTITGKIGTLYESAKTKISELSTKFGEIKEKIVSVVTDLKSKWQEHVEPIWNDKIKPLIDNLKSGSVIETISKTWSTLVTTLAGIKDKVWDSIGKLTENSGSKTADKFKALFDSMGSIKDIAWDALLRIGSILPTFDEVVERISQLISKLISGKTGGALSNVFNTIKNTITTILDSMNSLGFNTVKEVGRMSLFDFIDLFIEYKEIMLKEDLIKVAGDYSAAFGNDGVFTQLAGNLKKFVETFTKKEKDKVESKTSGTNGLVVVGILGEVLLILDELTKFKDYTAGDILKMGGMLAAMLVFVKLVSDFAVGIKTQATLGGSLSQALSSIKFVDLAIMIGSLCKGITDIMDATSKFDPGEGDAFAQKMTALVLSVTAVIASFLTINYTTGDKVSDSETKVFEEGTYSTLKSRVSTLTKSISMLVSSEAVKILADSVTKIMDSMSNFTVTDSGSFTQKLEALGVAYIAVLGFFVDLCLAYDGKDSKYTNTLKSKTGVETTVKRFNDLAAAASQLVTSMAVKNMVDAVCDIMDAMNDFTINEGENIGDKIAALGSAFVAVLGLFVALEIACSGKVESEKKTYLTGAQITTTSKTVSTLVSAIKQANAGNVIKKVANAISEVVTAIGGVTITNEDDLVLKLSILGSSWAALVTMFTLLYASTNGEKDSKTTKLKATTIQETFSDTTKIANMILESVALKLMADAISKVMNDLNDFTVDESTSIYEKMGALATAVVTLIASFELIRASFKGDSFTKLENGYSEITEKARVLSTLANSSALLLIAEAVSGILNAFGKFASMEVTIADVGAGLAAVIGIVVIALGSFALFAIEYNKVKKDLEGLDLKLVAASALLSMSNVGVITSAFAAVASLYEKFMTSSKGIASQAMSTAVVGMIAALVTTIIGIAAVAKISENEVKDATTVMDILKTSLDKLLNAGTMAVIASAAVLLSDAYTKIAESNPNGDYDLMAVQILEVIVAIYALIGGLEIINGLLTKEDTGFDKLSTALSSLISSGAVAVLGLAAMEISEALALLPESTLTNPTGMVIQLASLLAATGALIAGMWAISKLMKGKGMEGSLETLVGSLSIDACAAAIMTVAQAIANINSTLADAGGLVGVGDVATTIMSIVVALAALTGLGMLAVKTKSTDGLIKFGLALDLIGIAVGAVGAGVSIAVNSIASLVKELKRVSDSDPSALVTETADTGQAGLDALYLAQKIKGDSATAMEGAGKSIITCFWNGINTALEEDTGVDKISTKTLDTISTNLLKPVQDFAESLKEGGKYHNETTEIGAAIMNGISVSLGNAKWNESDTNKVISHLRTSLITEDHKNIINQAGQLMWNQFVNGFNGKTSDGEEREPTYPTTSIDGYLNYLRYNEDIVLKYTQLGYTIFDNISKAIRDRCKWFKETQFSGILTDLATLMNMQEVCQAWYATGRSLGDYIVDGIVDALNEGKSRITSVTEQFAGLIPETTEKVLDINSPSKVMYSLGAYTVEGFANGLSDTTQIDNAMSRVVNVVHRYSEEISDALESEPYIITPVVDDSNIRAFNTLYDNNQWVGLSKGKEVAGTINGKEYYSEDDYFRAIQSAGFSASDNGLGFTISDYMLAEHGCKTVQEFMQTDYYKAVQAQAAASMEAVEAANRAGTLNKAKTSSSSKHTAEEFYNGAYKDANGVLHLGDGAQSGVTVNLTVGNTTVDDVAREVSSLLSKQLKKKGAAWGL